MDIQLLDSFLIAVPKVIDDGDGDIKTRNAAYYIEKERDRFERKVTRGVIHSMPVAYSEAGHMPIDEGIPNYKRYISHDAIQQKVNEGYDWGNEKYHPGAHEGWQYVSRAEYGSLITAKEGDLAYFHPSVTEPENFIKEEGGLLLFKAQVHELIFTDRPQGFWLLVQPIAEASEKDGLVTSIDEKSLMLEGIVRYCRAGAVVSPGDHIYFQEGSDWPFDINGEHLFAMLEENVCGRKND